MRLLLIRHAQTTWNAAGRVQGQADPPLSSLGLAQCRALGDRMVGVRLDGLHSSDLGRARLQTEYPRLYARWREEPSWDLAPGGEGTAAFRERVAGTVTRLSSRYRQDQVVAVVTHVGVIRSLLSMVAGPEPRGLRWPGAIDNTSISTLLLPPEPDAWNTPRTAVQGVNDAAHLAGLRGAG